MIRKAGAADPPGAVRKAGMSWDSDAQRVLVPEDGKWLDFSVVNTWDLGSAEHQATLKSKYPAILRKYGELTAAPEVKSATVWCIEVKGRRFFVIITKDKADVQTFHAFDATVHELA